MKRITPLQRTVMMNPIIQFFKLVILSVKIMTIVALGHGGTRNE